MDNKRETNAANPVQKIISKYFDNFDNQSLDFYSKINYEALLMEIYDFTQETCPSEKKIFIPKDKEMLTKNENEWIYKAIECAFWISKASHVTCDREKTTDSFNERRLFRDMKNSTHELKNNLLGKIIKELSVNKTKYENTFPSWGKYSDEKNQCVIAFDVPGYGQVTFHTHGMNVDSNHEIPLYKYSLAGRKRSFPDPKKPANMHDLLVAKREWKLLDKLRGSEGLKKCKEISMFEVVIEKNNGIKLKPLDKYGADNSKIEPCIGTISCGDELYFFAATKKAIKLGRFMDAVLFDKSFKLSKGKNEIVKLKENEDKEVIQKDGIVINSKGRLNCPRGKDAFNIVLGYGLNVNQDGKSHQINTIINITEMEKENNLTNQRKNNSIKKQYGNPKIKNSSKELCRA